MRLREVFEMLQPVRKNALPEYTDYRDTGCEYSPRCQECPLERCVSEMPGYRVSIRKQATIARVRDLRFRAGQKINDIAAALGISKRTVYRFLAA